jgi:hypothetical protein
MSRELWERVQAKLCGHALRYGSAARHQKAVRMRKVKAAK